MEKIVFMVPGNEAIAEAICRQKNNVKGEAEFRRFPDGESYVRIVSSVRNHPVLLVCTLHRPDELAMSLYFFAKTARLMGAASITLIAPYLSYLRQDKIFKEGEAFTAGLFASFLSGLFDDLVTIDPHLHRITSLQQIYGISARIKSSTGPMAAWLKKNVKQPIIIGPDSESRQWVAALAAELDVPFLVLNKERQGDRQVKVSVPEIENYRDRCPVLLDDIISTGKTMLETIRHLKSVGMQAPVCVVVHPVFAEGAYGELQRAGAAEIVSCNTIPHKSNRIDVGELFSEI